MACCQISAKIGYFLYHQRVVMHMRRRRIRNANETLIDFLARELPPTGRDDAEHFAKAIREAGERRWFS
jgi:hypothetical protein